MKVVIDTNILVSAILKGRLPRTVIQFVIESSEIEWIVSEAILTEYKDVGFFGFCYAIDGVIRNETLIERDIAAIFVNCLRSGAN